MLSSLVQKQLFRSGVYLAKAFDYWTQWFALTLISLKLLRDTRLMAQLEH